VEGLIEVRGLCFNTSRNAISVFSHQMYVQYANLITCCMYVDVIAYINIISFVSCSLLIPDLTGPDLILQDNAGLCYAEWGIRAVIHATSSL
jgi:hypothetical protein